MVHRNFRPTLLLSLGLGLTACGGGGDVSNASPRLDTIPQQSTVGGTTFTFDLDDYVSDREGATLTYAVSSGGGSFAGSVYSNLFDTMGTYTVQFTVSDGTKTTAGSFDVGVTTANLVLVQEDSSGLLLVDSATNALVRVAAQSDVAGTTVGLDDGRLVYHIGSGQAQRLWVFDPMTRGNTQVTNATTGAVSYVAHTSDNQVVYKVQDGSSWSLYLFNPRTLTSKLLANAALATVTALVDADDIVWFELAVDGQADVYAYDPTDDETFAVGTATTDEQLQHTMPGGGVVFSRVGTGGEHDLFCYRVSAGLVEVGADIPALATCDKTCNGVGSDGQVVFSAVNAGNNELYWWNAGNGQTTTIASGADDVFDFLGAGNEVVYHSVVSGSEHDVKFHDLDNGTAADLYNGADIGTAMAVTTDGTTGWAIVRHSGATANLLAVSMVGTPSTQTWNATTAVATSVNVLPNGDVVGARADGTALNVFDVSAGTWGTAITGTGMAFGGPGLDAGDFVYSLTVSSQTDLSMWDASGTTSVVLSNTAGDDAFGARTEDGTILFTRVVGTNTTADLFVWDGATETQLTDEDEVGLTHDHTVVNQYSGAR